MRWTMWIVGGLALSLATGCVVYGPRRPGYYHRGGYYAPAPARTVYVAPGPVYARPVR